MVSLQFFLLPGHSAGHFFVAKISVEFIIGVYIAVSGGLSWKSRPWPIPPVAGLPRAERPLPEVI
jgi:hypothetical protein